MSFARDKIQAARFATLATIDGDKPHLVPIVFVLVGDSLITAVDHKPKSTRNLRRLANIEANPNVSVLVQHASEAWEDLWWVRVDGTAAVVDSVERASQEALTQKYGQYDHRLPDGPWIVVSIERIAEWSAS